MSESALLVRCAGLAGHDAEQASAGDKLVRASVGGVTATLRARSYLVDWTIDYCAGFFDFELWPQASENGDVVVTHDPVLLALIGSLSEATWEVECTWAKRRLDTGVLLVRLPVDGGQVYYVCFDRPERVVVVIDGDSADAPMVAVRSLRSLLLRRMERDGERFLHAAGVARASRCVLITGDKFAGKTTTMIDLLLRSFDMVTNDKVALRIADDGASVVVQGFPVAIGVRIGTLAGLSDPARVLEAACTRFTPADLTRQVAAYPVNIHRANIRIRCFPTKLAQMCGSRVASRGTLAGVIVPRYDPGAEFRVERLDRLSAARVLEAMRLDGIEAVAPEHGFFRALGPGPAPEPSPIDDLIATRLPIYAVTQNAKSAAQTASLVSRILELAGEPHCHDAS